MHFSDEACRTMNWQNSDPSVEIEQVARDVIDDVTAADIPVLGI